jgi:hypothetical protein
MSKQTVGIVVGRLLSDEDLRRRFARNRLETLAELCLRGFDLTPNESICSAERMLGSGSGKALWWGICGNEYRAKSVQPCNIKRSGERSWVS